MIPKLENLNIGQGIEIVQQPTHTYRLDLESNRINRYTDNLEAMEQAIYKILITDRYKYLIYDWNYGFEISDLFGKPRPYVYSELKRRVREALMQDDRVTDVDNFIFKAPARDVVAMQFTAHTIFGDIEIAREVNI